MVLGLIGGFLSLGLGIKWIGDYNEHEPLIKAAKALSKRTKNPRLAEKFKELEQVHTAGYLLLIGGALSIGAAVKVKKFPKVSGGVMAGCGVLPAVFAPEALLFTFFLLAGAALALLVKPPQAAAAAA